MTKAKQLRRLLAAIAVYLRESGMPWAGIACVIRRDPKTVKRYYLKHKQT